jgi:DNA-binding NtrC family response regulator
MVREKRFREDLFYRLNVIPIVVPPLRDRREDIPVLAEHFLRFFASEMGKSVTSFAPEALERLAAYRWPGNVRELENAVERAVALASTETIRVEQLAEPVLRPVEPDEVGPRLTDGFDLDAYLMTVEADLLKKALERSAGDRAMAARLLGISPRSLRYLLGKHQMA